MEEAGAQLLCTLVDQHLESEAGAALHCFALMPIILYSKLGEEVQLSRMLEILRWTAARVHPLSSIIGIIIMLVFIITIAFIIIGI